MAIAYAFVLFMRSCHISQTIYITIPKGEGEDKDALFLRLSKSPLSIREL